MFRRKEVYIGSAANESHVYLSAKDRSTHMQVIGNTGRGKSKFLEHMIREDIKAGRGLCLIDPHGKLYDALVAWIAAKKMHERRRIRLFSPTESQWAFAFNPLDRSGLSADQLPSCVDSMVSASAQVWGGEDPSRTPFLKRALRSIFYVLAQNGLSLLEARSLIDPYDSDGLRALLTANIDNEEVAANWREFITMAKRPSDYLDKFGSTANRLSEFLVAPAVRRTIGQTDHTINLRDVMDRQEVLLVNLSTGDNVLTDDNARLLGALLVNDLFVRARGRDEDRDPPFYLYIDECGLMLTERVARIIRETRKFNLHAVLAHQQLSHLGKPGEAIYDAVLSTQTKVVFGGLIHDDAERMVKEIHTAGHDLQEFKDNVRVPVTIGHEIVWLDQMADTHSIGTTRSRSRTVTEDESDTEDESASVTTPPGEDAEPIETTGSRRGRSRRHGIADQEGESDQEVFGHTRGRAQTLKPVIVERSTTVYTLEEQRHREIARLRSQPIQHAVVKLPSGPPTQIMTPTIRPARTSPENVRAVVDHVLKDAPFTRPAGQVASALEHRKEVLVNAATQMRRDRAGRRKSTDDEFLA